MVSENSLYNELRYQCGGVMRNNSKNKSILVVEDESLTAVDIMGILQKAGYNTIGPALSADEAIKYCEENKPLVVLMDIRLKGSADGVAAALEIHDKYDVPVVYITAHSDNDTIERVKQSDPYGYILKPFSERDLLLSVELAIHKFNAEKEKQRRERWFSTILRSIGDGVIVTDNSGQITFMNTAAELLTGYSAEEAKRKDLKEVFAIKVDSHKKKNDSLEFHDGFGEKKRINDSVLISKNGNKYYIEYNASSMSDIEGGVFGGVLVFRDISDRKKAQDEIHLTLSRLRKAMGGTIEAMAMTVETRDPYTAGHQRRVTDLARAIADKMDVSREQKDGIRMAGVIHDLGKISVPAEILSKPGKLSEMEFSLIKIHPQVGYDILKNIDFPWPVADIVYQHHERMDGSGYPNHLTGPEILIESRIIAVADVVEAMASHRPYRASLGLERAYEEIKSKRGLFYDADVVDACGVVITDSGFSFLKQW